MNITPRATAGFAYLKKLIKKSKEATTSLFNALFPKGSNTTKFLPSQGHNSSKATTQRRMKVKKIAAKKKSKVKKVMKEFEKGDLHSGSKKGPVVKNKDQALAIGYSEAKKGKK